MDLANLIGNFKIKIKIPPSGDRLWLEERRFLPQRSAQCRSQTIPRLRKFTAKKNQMNKNENPRQKMAGERKCFSEIET